MDEAIVSYLKKTYNLLVGESTAEQIKIQVGSAFPLEDELEMEVKGRDLVAGIPKTLRITSTEIRDALNEPISTIVEAVKQALEQTPPELSADILDKGIIMTGGSSLLRGLDERLRQETNLPVNVIDDPLTCVARGRLKIIENLDTYKTVLLNTQQKKQITKSGAVITPCRLTGHHALDHPIFHLLIEISPRFSFCPLSACG